MKPRPHGKSSFALIQRGSTHVASLHLPLPKERAMPTPISSSSAPPALSLLLLLTLISPAAISTSKIVEAAAATKPRVRNYSYTRLDLGGTGAYGPETTAFDCNGEGPYVSVSDGRIFKWIGSNHSWTEFATTSPYRIKGLCDGLTNPILERVCGRPLGLKFNLATCELYVTDAYFGLMVVGSKGGAAKQLVYSAEGVPFRFANALDIDPQKGVIYFTDSSTLYERWDILSIVATSDRTGRLLKYNIKTGKVKVLMRNIAFANGVALSKNKDFVAVAETNTGRVLRYWLPNSRRSHTRDLLIQLGGTPDNINGNDDGSFWVAEYPIPPLISAQKTDPNVMMPVKVSESGVVLEVLDNIDGLSVSNVQEYNNTLWLGSVIDSFVAIGTRLK